MNAEKGRQEKKKLSCKNEFDLHTYFDCRSSDRHNTRPQGGSMGMSNCARKKKGRETKKRKNTKKEPTGARSLGREKSGDHGVQKGRFKGKGWVWGRRKVRNQKTNKLRHECHTTKRATTLQVLGSGEKKNATKNRGG